MVRSQKRIDQKLQKLVPWLSKDGLFGFCDEESKLIIQPKYESASPFFNGYSVVGKHGKYGIIDCDGKLVESIESDEIRLTGNEKHTLAIKKKNYNAWWRLGQWEFWPGFSFFGTNSDKRLFDTKVPWASWEVQWLETGKVIERSNAKVAEKVYTAHGMAMLNNKVLVEGSLYQLHKRTVKRLARHIVAHLEGNLLLQEKNDAFRAIDWSGKAASSNSFAKIFQLQFKVDGKTVYHAIDKDNPYQQKIYGDGHGQYYVRGDLSKPIPKKIDTFPNSAFQASEIIQHLIKIETVSGTDYFLISAYMNDEYRFFILHKSGRWETDHKVLGGFRACYVSGKIAFPKPEAFGITEHLPPGFDIVDFYDVNSDKDWFIIAGKYKGKERRYYGMFNNIRKKWMLPPDYAFVWPLNEENHILKFQKEEYGLYGLFNIENAEVIVAPKYQFILSSGKVQLHEGDKYINFYINIENGIEYREK